MDEASGVTVAELIRALQIKGVPLPHEVGTFLALQVCEALMDHPREIDSEQVQVDAQGGVSVETGPRVPELSAAKSVVTLLGEVLVASAPGVPEVLLSLLDLEPLTQRSKPLGVLRDELEAALVPLNRGATMRILGRLAKDAFGISRAQPVEPRRTSDRALTSAIDDLLGIDTEAADAFVDRVSEPPAPAESVASTKVASHAAEVRVSKALGDMERTREGSRNGFKIAALLLLGIAIAVAAAMLVRNSDSSMGSRATPAAAPASETRHAVQKASEPPPRQPQAMGRLVLDSMPRGVQVLMAIKDASSPIVVESGVAHEFVVVLANGRSLRHVVPADAPLADSSPAQPWTVALGGSRDSGAAHEELGASLLRVDSLGAPDGHQGTLRLQAPADAAVYKFVGITPTEIYPLSTREDATFLLYHGGYAQTVVTVDHQQWASAAGDGGMATLSLRETLQPHS